MTSSARHWRRSYDDQRRAELSERTRVLTERYPLYADLAAAV